MWINGQHLGYRPYGFSTFYYDLTPHLHFGNEPNVVAVRVNNSGQPNLRWYSGSGIYRHTWLINTAQVYIDQWGTYITTPEITPAKTAVEVTTRVWNQLGQAAPCTLTTTLVGQDGAIVQSTETKAGCGVAGQGLRFCAAPDRFRSQAVVAARRRIFIPPARCSATRTYQADEWRRPSASGSIEFNLGQRISAQWRAREVERSRLFTMTAAAVGAAIPLRRLGAALRASQGDGLQRHPHLPQSLRARSSWTSATGWAFW